MIIDPLNLSQALIQCPSVTPNDGGSQSVLQEALAKIGFTCESLTFEEPGTSEVQNLYARIGTKPPNFCFAGHTDVVPEGPSDDWLLDPFSAKVKDGKLYGRGSSDMKSAIACFVSAVSHFIQREGENFGGSITFLITGDEEGPAINGTQKLLKWLHKNEIQLDSCLVGEPTNPNVLGEMIKIGRRGSLNATLTVYGIQGHTAYPHLADNPIHLIANIIQVLSGLEIDRGNAHFQPSTIQFSTVDVNNTATNVIPSEATAIFNVRFNNMHSSDDIKNLLRKIIMKIEGITKSNFELNFAVTGEAFLTPPGKLSDFLSKAILSETGKTPELSTSGGTSDARFIKDYCPVAEFGMVGKTMHKVNESIDLKDLTTLTNIYLKTLEYYFNKK